MINVFEFKKWLHNNTDYSDAVINDVVSRMKRADKILEWNSDETYIFFLEKNDEFIKMSVSVKSQIRKAVKYYNAFFASENRAINMKGK